MLEFTEFKKEFIEGCRDELAGIALSSSVGSIEIEERSITKAQRGELAGLIFKTPDTVCAPTYYVEDFYEGYKDGESLEQLVLTLVENACHYIQHPPALPDICQDLFDDPGLLRVRLLNRAKNSEYLKDVPYIEDCGLALIAEIRSGDYRLVVTNSMLEHSGIRKEELFDTALANSSVNDRATLFDLSEVFQNSAGECENLLGRLDGEPGSEVLGGASDPGHTGALGGASDPGRTGALGGAGTSGRAVAPLPVSLYVLSNEDSFYGAAALFYPGMLDKLELLMGGSFYVLPSSVHEVLLLPVTDGDAQKLADIIKTANRTVTDSNVFLADDLFICEAGRLRQVSYGGKVPAPGVLPC